MKMHLTKASKHRCVESWRVLNYSQPSICHLKSAGLLCAKGGFTYLTENYLGEKGDTITSAKDGSVIAEGIG